MKQIFAVILLTALGACSTVYTVDQEMAITCRSFESTLRIVTPFIPQMSPAQVTAVDDAVNVLQPSCKAAAKGGTPALNAMRAALQKLLTVEKEVKQ